MNTIKLYSKNVIIDNIIIFFYQIKNYLFKFKDEELLIFFNSLIFHFESYDDIISSIEYSINFVYNKKIFLLIIEDLKKGISFSEALKKSKKFSSEIVLLIKAGEKNNNLFQSFHIIKEILSSRIKKKKQIKNIIFYPFIVFFLFLIILYSFSNYVIPSLLDLLIEINPNSNKEIKHVLNFIFFIKYSFFLFLFILIGLFGLYFFYNSLFYLLIFNSFFLGSLLLDYYLYFISYNLSISLENGLCLLDALELIIESIEIDILKKKLLILKKDIIKGSLFSDALKIHKFIPDFLINIIKSGENVGKLTKSVSLCYKFYEEKYNEKIDKILNYIPVFLILIISFLLIIFIYLLFLPMYNLGV